MRPRTWLALLLVFAFVLPSCGDDEATTTTAGPATTAATTTTTTAPGTTEATTTTVGLEGPYEYLARAEAGEFAGTEVVVQTQWSADDAARFENAVADFAARTGINIIHEGITDHETVLTVRVEAGDPPDIAQLAQPGLLREFAQAGQAVNLSDYINVDQLTQDYSPAWTDLVTVDGGIYGVYFTAFTKSIVWYPLPAFEAAGYEVPTTWDELIALSDQIIADGNGNPWCFSIEHGDNTGWVATDLIEDILLRTAPPEVYDQWVAHEIPFNSPEVLHAAEMAKQILFTPDYVYGGTQGILSIWIGDTPKPMFDSEGPKCWLHKQATWIDGFFLPDTATDEEKAAVAPGVGSAFFFFPPIDEQYGNPVLGGGDAFLAFSDRPEVLAVIEYLATAEAFRTMAESGAGISPNSSVPLEWYADYKSQQSAAILAQATTMRFDASDNMPAEVGAGTFWSGMIDWIEAEGANTEAVFEAIENSWPES